MMICDLERLRFGTSEAGPANGNDDLADRTYRRGQLR